MPATVSPNLAPELDRMHAELFAIVIRHAQLDGDPIAWRVLAAMRDLADALDVARGVVREMCIRSVLDRSDRYTFKEP